MDPLCLPQSFRIKIRTFGRSQAFSAERFLLLWQLTEIHWGKQLKTLKLRELQHCSFFWSPRQCPLRLQRDDFALWHGWKLVLIRMISDTDRTADPWFLYWSRSTEVSAECRWNVSDMLVIRRWRKDRLSATDRPILDRSTIGTRSTFDRYSIDTGDRYSIDSPPILGL